MVLCNNSFQEKIRRVVKWSKDLDNKKEKLTAPTLDRIIINTVNSQINGM